LGTPVKYSSECDANYAKHDGLKSRNTRANFLGFQISRSSSRVRTSYPRSFQHRSPKNNRNSFEFTQNFLFLSHSLDSTKILWTLVRMNERTTLLASPPPTSLNPFASAFSPRQNVDITPEPVVESPTTYFDPHRNRLWLQHPESEPAECLSSEIHTSTTQHHLPPAFDDDREDDDSSAFSSDSLPPTFLQFRRSHLLIGIPISALILISSSLILICWTKELRWIETCLGATSYLASEALKQPTFELLAVADLILPTLVYSTIQEVISSTPRFIIRE
jgi:hypothetical protein